jgi:hypothetical protein
MTDSLYLDINLHEGMLMDKKKTHFSFYTWEIYESIGTVMLLLIFKQH